MDLTRIEITIAMFSGRPDPVMAIDGEQASDLLARLAPGEPIDGRQSSGMRPRLGYRGLVIRQSGGGPPGLPATFRLAGGRLLGPGLRHWVLDQEVEDYICSAQGAAGQVLDPADLAVLRDDLAGPWSADWWRAYPGPDAGVPPPPCPTAPEPSFSHWNDALARSIDCEERPPGWCRQCTNSCYNYATNIRTDTLAWPGWGSLEPVFPDDITAGQVRKAAFFDGLLDTPYAAIPDMCLAEGILVALAVLPGSDFTWYRKNRDGYWGHKPGRGPATDKDNSGVKIMDPRTCDRGKYTEFGGFMTVLPGRARIAGPGLPPACVQVVLEGW